MKGGLRNLRLGHGKKSDSLYKYSTTALQLVFAPFVNLRTILKLGDLREQIGAGTVEEPGQ